MSCQSKDNEEILSIINAAAEWTSEEEALHLKSYLPTLNNFVDCTQELQIGLQVINFTLSSFLSHIPLANLSERLLESIVPAQQRYLQQILEKPVKENLSETRENLGCLILSVKNCGLLMKYIQQQGKEGVKLLGQHLDGAPTVLVFVMRSTLKHCSEKNLIYPKNSCEFDDLLESLFIETIGGCFALCDIFIKIEWARENEEEMALLSEGCEGLSEVAHLLSCLSELKGSVTAWKTFTTLIQKYSNELSRQRLLLVPTVRSLKEEIDEGLLMIKSFENCASDKVAESEKVFVRVLKRCSFNLKILVIICEKFGPLLRGAHSDFLSVVIALLRYSSHGFLLEKLPPNFKEKIDDQLSVGVSPLLAHLRFDEEFIHEVRSWIAKRRKTLLDGDSGDGTELSESSDFVAYLLLLLELIKQVLSDPLNSSSKESLETFVVKCIFQTFPFCYAELSYPQKLPGLMYGGFAQEKISLYSYTLMYICGFVCVLNEHAYEQVERILFENAFKGSSWNVLLASDVLCFVARYGSGSLCESYCCLLLKTLHANPSMTLSQRHNCLALLARLLAFLQHTVAKRILLQWISENPDKRLVAEVVHLCSVPLDEETRGLVEEYLLSGWKTERSSRFSDPLIIKNLYHDLDVVRLYLKSSGNETRGTTLPSILKSVTSIFQKFPCNFIDCCLVSRLFCLLIQTAISILDDLTTDNISTILVICEEVVSNGPPDVLLCICNFLSALSKRNFDSDSQLDRILRSLSCLFTRLLQHPNSFVHLNCIKALVIFAQVSKHKEVFTQSLAPLRKEVRQEVEHFLEGTKTLEKNLHIHDYLRHQWKVMINSSSEHSHTKLPPNVGKETEGDVSGQNSLESPSQSWANRCKRRKCDQSQTEELQNFLDDIKCLLNHDVSDMTQCEKTNVKNKLLQALSLWKSMC